MNFIFDTQIVNLGIGLLGLILINILLGSITSIIEKKFDKAKLIQGLIKGTIVIISFIGVFVIGLLNPNVLLVSMNGQELNLVSVINAIVLAGFIFYGKQVLSKLSVFVNGNFDIAKVKDENTQQ